MRNTALLVGLALSVLASPTAAAPSLSVASLPWTESNRNALLAEFPTIASVNAFLHAVRPDLATNAPQPAATQFLLTDLNNDGNLELITNLSDDSRYYPSVAVIAKPAGQIQIATAYDGGAYDVPDLNDVVIDADGNRRHQLLLPRWLGGRYPGAAPGPVVYDIFDYERFQLRRANLRHSAYYRTVLLPRLAAQLAALRAEPKTSDRAIETRRSEDISAREQAYKAMADMLRTGKIP